MRPLSYGEFSTCFLELDIEVAKSETPPDVANATHLQDEQGSNTPTPPVDASVKQHLDEEGRSVGLGAVSLDKKLKTRGKKDFL